MTTSIDSEEGLIPRLSATDVTVSFGGLRALNSVDISVAPGSIVGLIGPNGAGKSTLFDVLSGLRRPQTGQVLIDGADVTAATPQERAGRGLARTFQHPELFLGLSVREHLVLAHRVKHVPKRIWTDPLTAGGFRRAGREETERIDLLLELLNLTQIQHGAVVGLPLGLARLVEIGRAIAREPRILLLDEASSGLDSAETEELVTVLKTMVTQHGLALSLLLVEHNVDLVTELADQIYVLEFGVGIANGTPEEIRNDAKVRAAYLGEELHATEQASC
jgi:branched-chain amino acid transport system ATP-binding protein